MDYLEQTLNIKMRYRDWDKARKLPYMITDRYDFRTVWLDDYKVVFVFVKGELDQLAALKNHLKQIRNIAEGPLVLILNKIDARRRQQLINAGIPFVVPDQQIYLPFLGTVLQERYSRNYSADDALMPSSELLLLHFIYGGCKPLYMNDAVHSLGFTSMTISRATRQLEAADLIHTYKDGVNKVMTSDLNGKELFEKAQPILSSPVKKTVFIDKNDLSEDLLLSGYSALSEYSLLSPPQVKCLATDKIPAWASGMSDTLLDSDQQLCLEIWRYDPRTLCIGNKVGLLPLALALKDDHNERIEQAMDEALEDYWEEYDG